MADIAKINGKTVKDAKAREDIEILKSTSETTQKAIEEVADKKLDKAGGTINGNLAVTGDLRVEGTTITETAETLNVKANVITTNAEGVTLLRLSGLGLRTDSINTYGIMYDPTSGSVMLGLGTLSAEDEFTFNSSEGAPAATRSDSSELTDGDLMRWDARGNKLVDSGLAALNIPTKAEANTFDELNTFNGVTTFNADEFHNGSIYANTIYLNESPLVSDGYSVTLSYFDGFRMSHGDVVLSMFLDATDGPSIYYNNGIDSSSKQLKIPYKEGTLARVEDIPRDYVSTSEFAKAERDISDIYTILGETVYLEQSVTQEYTARETAAGLDIIDGSLTPVNEIRGKTVATENLIPYPYEDTTKTVNGVTFTDNKDGSVTLNGTTSGGTSIFTFCSDAIKMNLTPGTSYYFTCPHGIIAYREQQGGTAKYITGNQYFTWGIGWIFVEIYIQMNEGDSESNLTVYPMLNAGTEAKPYNKWFAGLKNAYFEKIVSTGRNLLKLKDGQYTAVGVTLTVKDGAVTFSGTSISSGGRTIWLSDGFILPAGTYFISSTPTLSNSSCIGYISDKKNLSVIGSTVAGVFTLAEATEVGFGFNFLSTGTTYSGTYNIMLNIGASALPYEPYISDTLSVETPIELPEYDAAYPETGATKRQSNTKVFDGTEGWRIYTPDEGNKQEGYTCFGLSLSPIGVAPDSGQTTIMNGYPWVKYGYASTNSGTCQSTDSSGHTVIIKQNQYSTLDEWKAHVTELYAAGNPLTVTYKTAEATTEATPFDKSKYKAWKNGSETIEQGATDNSEYGAENTVTQTYATKRGGTP